MNKYRQRLFNIKKLDILKEFTITHYGYLLTESYYLKLLNPSNRSNYFDKLLCIYTKDHFLNKFLLNNKNLHRWDLNNRNKIKYEKNYPW